MNIQPIRTQEDYEAALKMLDQYWTAELGTEAYDYFDILCILILHYEKENRPLDLPDPIEALKYYMAQDGNSEEELGLVLKD
jgi:HTH-type transcriptional regulator/antitoxin HigA